MTHPSIAKRRRLDSELGLDARATNHQVQDRGEPSSASPTPDLREPHSTDFAQDLSEPTPAQVTKVGSKPKNVDRTTWCTCTMYCGGGRQVHLSTYYRHQTLTQKYESFKSSFGLSFPPESIQDVEENNEGILLGSDGDPIDDDDQPMGMSDH
ncbi:hypothetical protein L7F22_012780 [Adiantum nelumboides]|nr:hypothetical protein [Adiantum nelumboides]